MYRRQFVLVGVLFLLVPLAGHAAAPTPVGGRVTLLRPEGAVTPGEQLRTFEAPTIVPEPQGDFLVAWIENSGSGGRRVVLRSVTRTGTVGAGRQLFSQNDSPQGSLDNLQLAEIEGRLVATATVFELHVGRWIGTWEIRANGDVTAGTLALNLAARCFTTIARNESEFAISWLDEEFNFTTESPLATSFVASFVPSQSRWLLPRSLGHAPLPAGVHVFELPCPASAGEATAWWTYEQPASPQLHFAPSRTAPPRHLSGLRPPVFVAAIPGGGATSAGSLLIARKPLGTGLRVFRFVNETGELERVGDTNVGGRVLAADSDGRLIVAQAVAGGTQIHFLNANLVSEGAPFTVPSETVSAAFNASDEALVTWVRDPVVRPNAGSVTLIGAQLFRWP